MSSKNQETIWMFLSAYRKATTEQLSYLQLINDKQQLLTILESISHIKDKDVVSASKALRQLIDDDKIKFIKQAEEAPAQKSKHVHAHVNHVEKKYAKKVKAFLAEIDITSVQRTDLDYFLTRNKLDSTRAIELENDVRIRLGIDLLDWNQELRASARRVLGLYNTINDAEGRALKKAYVDRERVSIDEYKNVIEEESTLFLHEVNVSSSNLTNSSWRFWITPAVVALLAFAVFGLYLQPNYDQTNTSSIASPESANETNLVLVTDSITEDTIWHAKNLYQLSKPIFVEGKARLTIEPGTKIVGEYGSALIVTRDAELHARGQSNRPIVFTSSQPVGKRQRGDWGGLVLLGNASINQPSGQIEGIQANDSRGQFGGQDDLGSCGVLEYVRVEFAGFEVFANNELNGLTLGGCGQNTVVRHVQVHRAADDGIEMFGGLANLKNVVITGAKDDSLDWDMGWRGRVQFLIVQQYDDAGDNAFEADNWGDQHNAQPRSNPTMYNVTLVGAANPIAAQRALNLRRGTAGTFNNMIAFGQTKEFLDIRDTATATLAQRRAISFSNVMLFDIGSNGISYFPEEQGESDDDNGLNEEQFLLSNNAVQLGVSPQISGAQSLTEPNYSPAATSPAASSSAVIPQGEFWDESANYLGAIRPGAGESNWLKNWTAFPVN